MEVKCKKDIIIAGTTVTLVKDKSYPLLAENKDGYIIIYEELIHLFFRKGTSIKNKGYYFDDFFINIPEARKLKLDKI